MSQDRRTAPCPECGVLIRPGSPRCRPCFNAARVRGAEAKRICIDCGGLRWEVKSRRCAACARRFRAENRTACIDCGKQPIKTRSKRCVPCRRAAHRDRSDPAGCLPRFNAAAFHDLLARDDVDWTPPLLAADAGIGTRTVQSWLNGSTLPHREEWRLVASVLALRPCAHCGGSGTVDPTDASIAAVTASAQVPGVVLPDLGKVITGDGWALEGNALVLSIGDVQVRTTRQEARLLALLSQAGGRYVPAVLLSLALKTGEQAVRTYISRLRDKCQSAGLDLERVIQTNKGSGYRAVMADRTEASA